MEAPANDKQSRRRSRMRGILLGASLGALTGFFASYLSSGKYTSRSLIVAQQPSGDRWGDPGLDYGFLAQLVLAKNRLASMVDRMGIAKPKETGKRVEEIREKTRIEPASEAVGDMKFSIQYTDPSPQLAQQTCNGLTSGLLEEMRRRRQSSVDDTMDFLEKQVEDAKKTVQSLQTEIAKRNADKAPRTVAARAGDHKLARDYKAAKESYATLQDKLNHAKRTSVLFTGTEGQTPGISLVSPCSTSKD